MLAGTLGKGKVWAPSGPELLSLAFQPSPASKFIQGYLGAVISAVSIAVSKPPPAPHPSISGQTLSEGQTQARGMGDRLLGAG